MCIDFLVSGDTEETLVQARLEQDSVGKPA